MNESENIDLRKDLILVSCCVLSDEQEAGRASHDETRHDRLWL